MLPLSSPHTHTPTLSLSRSHIHIGADAIALKPEHEINLFFDRGYLAQPLPVWPDLAKFCRFGKFQKFFTIFARLFSIWQKIEAASMNFLWTIGQNFNDQNWKNNTSIMSHCPCTKINPNFARLKRLIDSQFIWGKLNFQILSNFTVLKSGTLKKLKF